MAQQQAEMPTIVFQRSAADFAARMGQDPRITRRVLYFTAETVVVLGGLGFGILDAALGAGPDERVLVGDHGGAGGGA